LGDGLNTHKNGDDLGMVYDMGFTTLALPTSERQGESAASCSEAKPTWKRWRNMAETGEAN